MARKRSANSTENKKKVSKKSRVSTARRKKRNKIPAQSSRKKLTKAEEIARKPIEEIFKEGGEEGRKKLEGYLRTLRTGYKRRVSSFKSRGLTSYAQISLEDSIPDNVKDVPISKLTRNQLILEVLRYSSFFTSETSTVKGIVETNRKQDERIFGVNERGKPKQQMTQEERKAFWSFYTEFMNQNGIYKSQVYSEYVQQYLGQWNTMDFEDEENRARLLEKAREEFYEYYKDHAIIKEGPNVLSGKGDI